MTDATSAGEHRAAAIHILSAFTDIDTALSGAVIAPGAAVTYLDAAQLRREGADYAGSAKVLR